MPLLAGLDGGGESHAACVIDQGGRTVARFEVRHDAAGLADILARLRRLAPTGELPIAIERSKRSIRPAGRRAGARRGERPSGLLVDTLVAAGHPVIPIHPNVVKACRPRYRAAAGKSDPGDAFMLADILRTPPASPDAGPGGTDRAPLAPDGHRFRPLAALPDEVKAVRAPSPGRVPGAPRGTGSIAARSMVRGRDDLVAQRVALANQLRSLLDGFWPGAAAVFAAIDSPIAPAFLRYPTPDSAARLGAKRIAGFMAQHAYRGRRSPAELLARLRAAPTGLAGDPEADSKGELARAFAAVLERLVAEIARFSSRIEHAVADLPDGQIVMSFPRAGRTCAAQILAEIGHRDRFQTEDQLAAEAGAAPVAHASGKVRSGMLRTGVVFRWACNHRLRRAVTCFADNSRHASAWQPTSTERPETADASTSTPSDVGLTRDFVTDHLVAQGVPVDWAIYCVPDREGRPQPHAHIQFPTRELSADGWQQKLRHRDKKPFLRSTREVWAKRSNQARERDGRDERVTHLSFKAQGVDLEPTI